MNISAPFIRRPVATALLMVGMLLAGLVVFPLLPVAPLPQIDFPTISVTTQLPGASAETIASTVSTPLEYQFAQISGLSQMSSSNVLGSSTISLQFDLDRNIDAAAQDVQSAIDAASGQLPRTLPIPPTYRKVNPADTPIIVIAVQSDVLPITELDEYAENILAQQLSQLRGVAQVSIGGQQKPAIRVQVDPTRLAAVGLQLEDVANVITAATVDTPKGSLDGQERSLVIDDNDQLVEAASWNDVIIAFKNGAPIRIRDVGVAVSGPENRLITAWQNGHNGIQLLVIRQPGANVIDVVRRVQETLPRALASVPPSVRVFTTVDRTVTIKASVHDVEATLLFTLVLVVGVIFVFLRSFWATIIPSVTIPVALFGTAALMYVAGYSLDNLSLMALTISVGFVVDDAIVMLENIYRYVEGGDTPLQAALKGSAEVGFTIVAISISLVAVFIPILLMSGIVGRLFREFAVVMTMTIGLSALVALTLSPMMCAMTLRSEKHGIRGHAYQMTERAFARLLAGYTRALDWVLAHQRLTLFVFVATVVSAVAMYAFMPKGFFPQQDTGIISAQSDAPENISFAEMVKRQHALTDIVAANPNVASYASAVGGGRPMNNGFLVIGLKPRDERKASADEVIDQLRSELSQVPGAALFMQSAQDLNVGARFSRTQFQYTLQDANLAELYDWAPRILDALREIPVLRDVASDQQVSSGLLAISIDRDRAASFGLYPAAINAALYDAFGQRQVTQYFTQANVYHVVLEITPELQGDPKSLEKIYLRSPLTNAMVPLSEFSRFDSQHVTYLSVNHQGQFASVTLSFNLAAGAALGDAVRAVDGVMANAKVPNSLVGSFQGAAQAFQSSIGTQVFLILGALVAIYLILGMLYESFIHPLTILSTLPSAGLGGLLLLSLMHVELSLIAFIGIILLLGIVKKNGIMLVDFAIAGEREEGLSAAQAIRRACLMRFRPIMMTTMAALLGAVPLALGQGTGGELRRPLGLTLVGGLVLSQALTLFSTPVIYLYLDQFTLRRLRRKLPLASS